MNYPSLSLSLESIQNAFKVKQSRANIKIEGRQKKDFQVKDGTIQECEKGSFQSSNFQTVSYNIITKRSMAQEKGAQCIAHVQNKKHHRKCWQSREGTEGTCQKCDFKTQNCETLRSHIKTKHSKVKKVCWDCDYSHAIASKVASHHRQVHLGVIRWQKLKICRKDDCSNLGMINCPKFEHCLLYCEQCEYSTTTSEYLKNHVRNVHSSKDLEGLLQSCKQCDYRTRYSSDLIRHEVNKHMDEESKLKANIFKKCSFENCLFKTTYPYVLKRHIESKHDGIVHFRCKHMNCSYVAVDKKVFKAHAGTHNSEFKCDFCGKVLAGLRNSKSHMKNVHGQVHL